MQMHITIIAQLPLTICVQVTMAATKPMFPQHNLN